MSLVPSFMPPVSPFSPQPVSAPLTPWLISWPATSISTRGLLLPAPSPYVISEPSQNALMYALP